MFVSLDMHNDLCLEVTCNKEFEFEFICYSKGV